MDKAIVRWFDNKKGYGFLEREDGTDLFVHFSAIEMEGYKTLKAKEEVLYEVVDGEKGPQAANVTRTGATAAEKTVEEAPEEAEETPEVIEE